MLHNKIPGLQGYAVQGNGGKGPFALYSAAVELWSFATSWGPCSRRVTPNPSPLSSWPLPEASPSKPYPSPTFPVSGTQVPGEAQDAHTLYVSQPLRNLLEGRTAPYFPSTCRSNSKGTFVAPHLWSWEGKRELLPRWILTSLRLQEDKIPINSNSPCYQINECIYLCFIKAFDISVFRWLCAHKTTSTPFFWASNFFWPPESIPTSGDD